MPLKAASSYAHRHIWNDNALSKLLDESLASRLCPTHPVATRHDRMCLCHKACITCPTMFQPSIVCDTQQDGKGCALKELISSLDS